MSKLADKQTYLEVMTEALKEAQAGDIPKQHKDEAKYYIMFLEKEVLLMKRAIERLRK